MNELGNIIELVHSKDRANIELGLTLAKGQRLFTKLKKYLTEYYGELILNSGDIDDMSPDAQRKIRNRKLQWWQQRLHYMNNMERVYIRYELENLPKNLEISKCTILKSVNGNLKDLSGIEKLKNLEMIDICECPVKEIPETIDKCSKLELIRFEMSEIKTIPESILNLTTLKVLNIYVGCLSRIPEGLLQMPNLKILNLSGNNIKSLPKNLVLGNNFTGLHLEYNRLPDEEIARLYKANKGRDIKIECSFQQGS